MLVSLDKSFFWLILSAVIYYEANSRDIFCQSMNKVNTKIYFFWIPRGTHMCTWVHPTLLWRNTSFGFIILFCNFCVRYLPAFPSRGVFWYAYKLPQKICKQNSNGWNPTLFFSGDFAYNMDYVSLKSCITVLIWLHVHRNKFTLCYFQIKRTLTNYLF